MGFPSSKLLALLLAALGTLSQWPQSIQAIHTCIQGVGTVGEVRNSSSVDCFGGDVHLEVEALAVGLNSASGCLGSTALYKNFNGTAWDTVPLAAIVDHDLDGMQNNFKGDSFRGGYSALTADGQFSSE